jgi:hypothetical protein
MSYQTFRSVMEIAGDRWKLKRFATVAIAAAALFFTSCATPGARISQHPETYQTRFGWPGAHQSKRYPARFAVPRPGCTFVTTRLFQAMARPIITDHSIGHISLRNSRIHREGLPSRTAKSFSSDICRHRRHKRLNNFVRIPPRKESL